MSSAGYFFYAFQSPTCGASFLRKRITRYLEIKSKYCRGPQKLNVGVNCEENMPQMVIFFMTNV